MTDEIIHYIPGAQSLFDLFGHWPSFHDAEVVSLKLDRAGESELIFHTFGASAIVDSTGHFIIEKHTIVSVHITDILDTEILGFNKQNVVSGIVFSKEQ